MAEEADVDGSAGSGRLFAFSRTIAVERLFFAPELISSVLAAVAVAPVGAEAIGQPRVQAAEQHLAHTALEEAQHQTIVPLCSAQCVAVAEQDTLAVDLDRLRLREYLNSHLLPEGIEPDVVVAGDVIYLDSRLEQSY